ncbi:MAG: hypothetical protein ABI548_24805 [Polyangiaceae bacterium]
MASVVHLSRYRSVARGDLPLDIPAGDSDLRPIAIVLWLASLIRVSLAFAHREAFGMEATLALMCVVLLPMFAIRARHRGDTAKQ